MRIRDRSALTVTAVVAWLALGASVLSRPASESTLPLSVTAVAVAVLGLAIAAAGRSAAHGWRGPALRSFRHDEAVCCTPGEAAVVREAAQLRGTLGGAGHVHPARLVLSVSAWLAAAGSAAAVLRQAAHPVLLLWGTAVVLLCLATLAFPARPFHYREANGGRVVVHPHEAFAELMMLRMPPLPEAPAARATPAVAESATGWGTSSNTVPAGGKAPDGQVDVPS